MTAQEGIDGAFAATYVPQDVAAARQRAANQAAARKRIAEWACRDFGVDLATARSTDLAVRLAAERYRLDCQILGIDEPAPRQPGTCEGCGNTLPMSATFHQSAGYRGAFCHTCTAERSA